MNSTAKSTIIAALIAAMCSIIVALISVFGNPPAAPPIDVPPDVVTPEEPVLSCPQPPPVERINVTTQEGKVWIQAEWNWDGGKFEFTPGHWERERADYGAYVPGHWDTNNRNCVWIPGAL